MEKPLSHYLNPPQIGVCAGRLKAAAAKLEAEGTDPSVIAKAFQNLAMDYALQANSPYYRRHLETMIVRGQANLRLILDVVGHTVDGSDVPQ